MENISTKYSQLLIMCAHEEVSIVFAVKCYKDYSIAGKYCLTVELIYKWQPLAEVVLHITKGKTITIKLQI